MKWWDPFDISVIYILRHLFIEVKLTVLSFWGVSFGEVMKSKRDIEIIYKKGIVRSVKGKSKKLTKKESKRIQKHIDAIVKSYAEDDW